MAASNFKEPFATTQSALRAAPDQATATFAAETRQIEGLLSEATIRDFRLRVDEPPALGGQDHGPNPVELVLAALGTCQEITYRLYADALGIPLNAVSVKLEGSLDLRGFFGVDPGVRPGFRNIHATVTIDSPASRAEIERLKAEVDFHCPVLDVLRHVTPVRLDLDHVRSGAAKTAAA